MPADIDVAGLIDRVPTGLFIDGAWREGGDGRRFDVLDPATEFTLATVADAAVDDGAAALAAAHAAQSSWAATPTRGRAEILRTAFDLLTERAEVFAHVMTLEMGKPLAESRGEVTYGAEFLRWFSEEAARVGGRYATAPDGCNRLVTLARPVGPCLLITPWNFPLAMVTRKVAPAIAAGCTMVLKPSELTPLTALLFTELLTEAGLPPGVLNVLPTSRAAAVTAPLLADARLRKLSFTGSTAVGRQLLAASAPQVLRTSMELGGNAPFLVFDDADIAAAVEGAAVAKMRNGGQACVAANRFLVHETVAAEFTERLVARLQEFALGPGIDPASTLGPLIDARAHARLARAVAAAVDDGARVALSDGATPEAGFFMAPTVLADVPRDARILSEEIFGPVAPIVTFRDEDDAIELANATEHGLVAFAYTRDLGRSLRLPERLETGMLGLNTGLVSTPAAPFGGVKQSGLGREGGREGIAEYLETTYVAIGDPFADTGVRA